MYAYETQKELRLIPWLAYDARVDFAYFFAGAEMAANGDAYDLYPRPAEFTVEDDYALAQLLARGNYYNPPALAFIEAPFTALSFRGAYWTFSAFSIVALGGFVLLSWQAGRGIPELPLLIIGALAFRPVHEAIIMGSPSSSSSL
jgi:hypothetical protein